MQYAADGFIHLTADPKLLLTVANHFYRETQGDWIVLVIDATKLSAEASGGRRAGRQEG